MKLLPYAEMVRQYKDQCPVPVSQYHNFEKCPANGACANVMFQPMLHFILDHVFHKEGVVQFTTAQKKRYFDNLKNESMELYGKWDESMELVLLNLVGDTCRTANGLKEILRFSLNFINDEIRRNSGRGEYVHHIFPQVCA